MRTPEEQLRFFRNNLGRLQGKNALEAFRADLSRSNLDVMWGALLAAEAFVQRYKRPAKDSRAAVLLNYQRISASIAQLYPMFFVFESAWRTYVADRLDLIHGCDDWWHDVRDTVAQGGDVSMMTTLGSKPARRDVIREIAHVLGSVGKPSDLETTFELTQAATLKSLEFLIDSHWGDMSSPFSTTQALGRPTSGTFADKFKVVRLARNDAYHHRIVKDRSTVVAAAEQLVDLLDIHMGDQVAAIGGANLPGLNFAVVRQGRHA